MQLTYWQALLFGALVGIAFGVWIVKDDWDSKQQARIIGELAGYALVGAVAGAIASKVNSRTTS